MPTVARTINKIKNKTKKFISPVFTKFTVPPIAAGIALTIPAKMIKLVPFPIPL